MPKLSKTKLGHYRRQLVEILQKLGVKIDHLEDSVLRADNDPAPDAADEFSSDNYHQELQLGLIENEEEILREIQDAVERVDAGTFGVCENCQKEIPARRLEVLPYARHCVSCQREVETNGDGDDD